MTLRPFWKIFLSGVECGDLLSGDGGHDGQALFSMDTKVKGIGACSCAALERCYLVRH